MTLRYTGAMQTDSAILITGAARRIGRAIALHLAGCGYDIAIHYHNSQDEAESLKAEIEILGRKAALIEADLMAPDAAAIISEAKSALPHLNGLIHNASIFKEAEFLTSDAEELEHNLSLHVKTPYLLSQAFAKQVGHGAIITMLDTNIRKNSKIYFPYMLSKKALSELTKMLAKELAPAIRVNAIAPGITPFSDELPNDYVTRKLEELPLRAVATPQDIAEAARYLLEAPYLVGHTFFIDGGDALL